MSKRNFELTRSIDTASGSFLQSRQQGPISVIRFLMGLSWALTLTCLAPGTVIAAVLFYGIENVDSTTRDAFLGHFSKADRETPVEWSRRVESEIIHAGLKVSFYQHAGAGHWFFESDQPDTFKPDTADLV